MSNYQEGNGPYTEGTPGAGGQPYQETGTGGPGAYQGGEPSHVGGAPQYETQQFPSGGPQRWEGQQGYQGQGNQGQQGFFQGGNPLSSHGRNKMNVRSTFKTTEFWILIIVSLALLIAAAVTDQGTDNQGFGAREAWKYVTWLSIAYIVSRGLTKFAGNERGNDDNSNHRR